MNLNKLLLLASALTMAPLAVAQIPPALPYTRTFDLNVVDSTFDGVWRLSDQNQDGDYNDLGEVITFYSDLTPGGVALTNPTCIVTTSNGTTYIADSTIDIVLALRDQNGDGDANDAGEYSVFFNSITNANGIVMASAQGITVDALGRLFIASSNAGSSGQDIILKLEDLNADGDANDVGESFVYCLIPTGAGAVGNSIPTKVIVGPDLNLYYTDVASTTPVVTVKGVYRLQDNNSDGDANDAGEVTLFWTPPFSTTPFYWSLAVDWQGNFYVTDHNTNRNVWRGRDADNSGFIDAAETTLFFNDTVANWWDVVLRDDGVVLLVNSNSPDRLTACLDLNNDGDAMDAGEVSLAYDSTAAATAISVRGAAFTRAPVFDPITPVPIGQTTGLSVHAVKPGDLCVSVFSLGLGVPFPLAPWGKVEIDISQFLVFGFGIADANGSFLHTFTAPNTPSAIGTYAFQALCGDNFRLFLSNPSTIIITP